MSTSSATGSDRVDAVEFLTAQHRRVEELWADLQVEHGRRIGDQARADDLVRILSQHDAIETMLLYPELREAAGAEGRRWSDHSLAAHQQVREQLQAVDGHDIADVTTFTALHECIGVVMHHVEDEEGRVFPLLRQHVGERRLEELGRRMAEHMEHAPTHPHPMTPDGKLGATVAGTVAGAFDRARDAVSGRGSERR